MGYVILLPASEPRGAGGVDVHKKGHCENEPTFFSSVIVGSVMIPLSRFA
jgi:hypothetical protein